jgi:hypothetical protein
MSKAGKLGNEPSTQDVSTIKEEGAPCHFTPPSSGQQIPDSDLSFSSLTVGATPSLAVCGLRWL